MAREILHITGLEKTTPEFRQKLVEVADRRGLVPGFLAAVICFESQFDPQAVNPHSGATGLIQWLAGSARLVGTTQAELMQMSAVEQLDYVERWYEEHDPQRRIRSAEDHYLAVFAPKYMFRPPGTAVFTRPEGGCTAPPRGYYCQNAGLDKDGDGVITNTDAAHRVMKLIADARERPPLIVDGVPGNGNGPSPPPHFEVVRAGVGAGGVIALLAGGVLGFVAATKVITKGRRRARSN